MNTPLLITFLGSVLLAWSAPASDQALSEQEVVRQTLAMNPSLKAAAAKWAAFRERVPQARAWEDPMVGVDFERMGTTRLDTYSDAEWMASQTLPLSGKNLSRARASEAEAWAAYEEVRRTRLDITAKAKTAYYRLANAHAQLSINRENRELVERILETGAAKVAVGKSTQGTVLATEADLQRLNLETAMLEQARSEQETALNVLMNRPPGAPLGPPAALAFREAPAKDATLESRLLASRPEIAAAEHRLKAEEARLQLAHRQWIPDPQVRIEARHFRGSSDVFTEYDTGVFISVPWANPRKYSAGVREAQNMVDFMRNEILSERNSALGMLRDQLRRIATLRRQYELSSGKLVPLARKTVETLRINYQADTANLTDLLIASRSLRETEAAASTQLADYLAALAELESIVGSDSSSGSEAKAVVPAAKRRNP